MAGEDLSEKVCGGQASQQQLVPSAEGGERVRIPGEAKAGRTIQGREAVLRCCRSPWVTGSCQRTMIQAHLCFRKIFWEVLWRMHGRRQAGGREISS